MGHWTGRVGWSLLSGAAFAVVGWALSLTEGKGARHWPWILLAGVVGVAVGLIVYERWLRGRASHVIAPLVPVNPSPHTLSSHSSEGATGRCEPGDPITILGYRGPRPVVECVVGREGDTSHWTWTVPDPDRHKAEHEILFPTSFPGAPPQYIPGVYHFEWLADIGGGKKWAMFGGRWKLPDRPI